MIDPTTFPIVVSGPSGAGKTTLLGALLASDPRLKISVSVTTRPPRDGETEAKSYFFITPREFEALKRKELMEWAKVHGALYGTPAGFVREQLAAGFDVVLNIDTQGGGKVKKVFPDAVMIFILPPTFEVLRGRIEKRGSNEAGDIELRLKNAKQEIEAAGRYEYLVINDTIDSALGELKAIISAERYRRERRLKNFLVSFFESK
jgi:guanylate kinase